MSLISRIKHDNVLGRLKFVAKGEDSQVSAIPKKARKGTKAANVPKKKDSLFFNDNIITDDPDVALELGKSISSSKGAGIQPEVLDEPKEKLADSSEGTSTSLEDKEDDKSIDIQETDDERTKFDNDDVEMADVTKTNADKAEEEENVEKAKEEKKEEELKGDDQAKNEQEVGPVMVTHK
ncbi:hypothetical protein Tco_0958583, partial [Tanacetum coccineum]